MPVLPEHTIVYVVVAVRAPVLNEPEVKLIPAQPSPATPPEARHEAAFEDQERIDELPINTDTGEALKCTVGVVDDIRLLFPD